ncbi:MAG: fimbrillin family protein [Prevotella sp.]|jgi:hypothetical protein|nr:fimbrillin family protein [Prevotella sp.]
MIEKRRNFVFRFLPGLFLSGLLLLSGCSQDDVSGVTAGSRAIGFRAQGGMSALKATTASTDNIQSFVVSAHHSDASWDADSYLLHGTTVYRGEGSTSPWTYSPQAYFPTATTGSVEFMAYSPAVSAGVDKGLKDATVTIDPSQTITYTVPLPNGSATTQEDLLVAHTNVLPASYSSSVSLQFRHALSRVLVAASSTLAVPVSIRKLTLKNLYSQGELSLAGVPKNGDWGYTSLENIGATASPEDVYKKWNNARTPVDYTYELPASGVSVAKWSSSLTLSDSYLTGLDQGMFVLPQTTAVTAFGDEDYTGEFYLEVEYSINGAAPETGIVQFNDQKITTPSVPGFTFENGRQYVLTLAFGAGKGGDTSIDIGSSISFGEIAVSDYGRNVNAPTKESDSWPEFAQSNIYYDATASVQTLTFSANASDGKNGYQGLFFKYGSLIGVSARISNGIFGTTDYLFIPDFSNGKYTKIQVSALASHDGGGDAVDIFKAALVQESNIDWGNFTYPNLWAAIPFVADGDVPTNGSGRNENGLTVNSGTSLYEQYKGDICKFMSGKPSTSGLSGAWRLPVSSEFGPNDSYYTKNNGYWNEPFFSGGIIEDGTGIMEDSATFCTFSRVLTGTDTPLFPASGYRSTGNSSNIGNIGIYRSSSADSDVAANAYILRFDSNVNPYNSNKRVDGYSIRCVREQ